MISLRRRAIALPLLAVGGLFGACNTGDITRPSPSGASATTDRDGGGDKDSQKAASCPVSARVLIDQFGNATLEVRSGTFDNSTNTGIPYGKIQNVAYTVKSSKGKELLEAEAKVKPANALFTTSITVLQPAVSLKTDDDRGSSKSTVKAAVLFDAADSVLVTATIGQPSTTPTNDNGNHGGGSDNNDDDASGHTCTVSVVAVVLKPTDIAVSAFERLVDGGTPVPAPSFGDVNPGSAYTFAAWVTSPAGSLPADVTCSVTVTGTSGVANYQMAWLTQRVHVNGGGKEACRFTLTPSTPDTYTIGVTATSAGDPNVTNNASTGKLVVKPNGQTIDVFVRSIVLDLGAGATAPLGQIKAGVAGLYIAAIGATPGVGNQMSSPVTCSIKVTNIRTGVVSIVPGTVVGSASTTTDALCRFSLTLAGNGDVDDGYRIEVTAQPTTATDIAPGNNTLSASQTAIVRVDVSVSSVQLSVDGVIQTTLTNIAKGKTGNYRVTFVNGSNRDATITCVVTAGAPSTVALAVPLVAGSPARLLVPANGTASCNFDYVFPQIMAVNFTVSASSVTPIDESPDNNVFSFQTTAVSDHTFPAIGVSNVHALQSWVTDAAGVPITLNEETANITRITLTFATTTTVLGDFTLSGTVTTDAPPNSSHPVDTLSKSTWTVLGLLPRSCVTGVDPGYRSVNQQKLTLTICAADVPGDPTTQAISIEYGSSSQGLAGRPDPLGLFGTSVTFDVSLGWKLFGSSISDHAGATVQFQLQDVPTGFTNVYQKTNTGQVIVTRNGG